MKYTILTNRYADELAKEVTRYMENGWKPQGGLCLGVGQPRNMCSFNTNEIWSQAMIKEEEK